MSIGAISETLPQGTAENGVAGRDALPNDASPLGASLPARSTWLRKLGIGSGAAVLAGAIAIETVPSLLLTEHTKTFGTITSPTYALRSDLNLHPYTTYGAELAQSHAMALELREKLASALAVVNQVKEELALGPSEEELALHRGALDSIHQQFFYRPLGEVRELPTIEPTQNVMTPDELPAGFDPVSFGIKLTERIFNKPLPSNLVITYNELPARFGILGVADSVSLTITISPSKQFALETHNKLTEAGVVAHEVGHLVFAGMETQLKSWQPWRFLDRQIIVREEAVAVLTQLLAGSQVDPDLDAQFGGTSWRYIFSRHPSNLVSRYYDGDPDYGIYEGATVANAAVEHFGGLKEAFDALTSAEPMPPEIYLIIERDRALYHQIANLDTQNGALRAELQVRIDGAYRNTNESSATFAATD